VVYSFVLIQPGHGHMVGRIVGVVCPATTVQTGDSIGHLPTGVGMLGQDGGVVNGMAVLHVHSQQ
jgi:hypothetical protein